MTMKSHRVGGSPCQRAHGRRAQQRREGGGGRARMNERAGVARAVTPREYTPTERRRRQDTRRRRAVSARCKW